MAFYPALEGPALDAYRKMVTNLKARAQKELNLTEDEIVVRQLRPADLYAGDASTPDYNIGLTTTTWTNIVNAQTIADNRFVGINGFMVRNSGTAPVLGAGILAITAWTPAVEQVRITRKGSVARYYVVKAIPVFESQIGYTDEPVTIDQNTTVTIEGLARLGSSISTTFDILGAVVEKKGLLINP